MTDAAVSPRLPLAAVGAGVVAALVGFGSAFPVVVQGLQAVGANEREVASGLMALSVLMGLTGILLSLRSREPVSIAWSTPGAALLISTGMVEGGFSAAVGAFVVTGLLIVGTAVWRGFRDLVASIPAPLASAMLAGILLRLCLAPVEAAGAIPAFALPVIAVWAVMLVFARLYASLVAVTLAAVIVALSTDLPVADPAALLPDPVLVAPLFTWEATVSIAVPLFIVTMASQNIPGIAVLRANGYRPKVGEGFLVTGIATMLAAPFGGHALNYAAITAAMCAGPDVDPDPGRRWIATVTTGVVYLALGLAATFATVLIAVAPPLLIQAVAGLALLGPLAGAMLAATQAADGRDAAIVTFVVAASGLSFFGIGAAFWGLVAGGIMLAIGRLRRSARP